MNQIEQLDYVSYKPSKNALAESLQEVSATAQSSIHTRGSQVGTCASLMSWNIKMFDSSTCDFQHLENGKNTTPAFSVDGVIGSSPVGVDIHKPSIRHTK